MEQLISFVNHSPHIQMDRTYNTDAGFDLKAWTAGYKEIRRCDATLAFPTGVHLNIPVGWYARIIGRSSTPERHGIIVLESIIDAGYTGEIFITVMRTQLAMQRTGTWGAVLDGKAIAQVIFVPLIPTMVLVPADVIETHTERGDNGWGSTG